MTLPPSAVRTEAEFFLVMEADARGVSPDSLTTLDLQTLAYGIRLAAGEVVDATSSKNYLEVANAIDGLADLEPDDIAYLEGLPGSN